jgi:hypothetical protein
MMTQTDVFLAALRRLEASEQEAVSKARFAPYMFAITGIADGLELDGLAVQAGKLEFAAGAGEHPKCVPVVANTVGAAALSISGHYYVATNELLPELERLEKLPIARQRLRKLVEDMGWQIDGRASIQTGEGLLTASKPGKTVARVELKTFETVWDWLSLHAQVVALDSKQ